MDKAFLANISAKKLWKPNQRLLLALSGGADSVALFHLLKESGFSFSAAHCNFKLRGEESEEDEHFVTNLCKKHKIKLYTKSFDTMLYARDKKLSVQMAARELRYNYFNELLSTGYDILLTAHHADDNIETFFVNLIRGTGIKGLSGIPIQNNKIVRPLLYFSRKEIMGYIKRKKINYREDSSNSEDKYLRNKLRLKIIPELEKLNPSLKETILKEIGLIRKYHSLVEKHLLELEKSVVIKTHEDEKIEITKLLSTDEPELFLYQWLNKYGFSSSSYESIVLALNGIPGKVFYSQTHVLLIDRRHLVLKKVNQKTEKEYVIFDVTDTLNKNIKMELVSALKIDDKKNVAYLNKQKLIFPMKVRKWKLGDKFKPLGLNRYKKLSDFFVASKLNRFEKEKIKVLENANGDIIWVINHRIDERYKVTNDSNILKITWSEAG